MNNFLEIYNKYKDIINEAWSTIFTEDTEDDIEQEVNETLNLHSQTIKLIKKIKDLHPTNADNSGIYFLKNTPEFYLPNEIASDRTNIYGWSCWLFNLIQLRDFIDINLKIPEFNASNFSNDKIQITYLNIFKRDSFEKLYFRICFPGDINKYNTYKNFSFEDFLSLDEQILILNYLKHIYKLLLELKNNGQI